MTMLNKPTRIYISGQMTGLVDHGFPIFNAEADRLRALGYDVVNPVDLNPDPSTPWVECIVVDLRELAKCDTIAMLSNWEVSFGAKIEMLAAQRMGLTVVNCADIVNRAPDAVEAA